MNKLYIITGPPGVGKSTISSKVAESLKRSVLIEGDDIYHLVKAGYISPWKEGNHLNLFWENSISLINNSLKNGYDVVFNYIINKNDLNFLKNNLPSIQIKFICLMVDEKTIVQRDKLRPKDCQMGERSLILLNKFKNENFKSENILDTSTLSIQETYQHIINENRFILN